MNSASVSGRVVRTWNVAGDTFYRVITQRRPGMLPNPDGKNFDALTVRFPNALGHAPIWTEGTEVEVVGYIQQMDVETPLTRLVDQRRVKGLGRNERAALTEKVGDLVLAESRVEVVAERWHVVRVPTAEEREQRAQRGQQRGQQRGAQRGGGGEQRGEQRASRREAASAPVAAPAEKTVTAPAAEPAAAPAKPRRAKAAAVEAVEAVPAGE